MSPKAALIIALLHAFATIFTVAVFLLNVMHGQFAMAAIGVPIAFLNYVLYKKYINRSQEK